MPSHAPNKTLRAARTIGSFIAKFVRGLFEYDLAHIGRIDRHPTKAREIDFRTAVLRLGDDLRAGSQTFVTEFRWRHANAVDVTRRHARCPGQTDIQRVKIGAFAAKVAALEHSGDIAVTAAARLGIAERIVHDPLVNGARLLDVGLGRRRRSYRTSP